MIGFTDNGRTQTQDAPDFYRASLKQTARQQRAEQRTRPIFAALNGLILMFAAIGFITVLRMVFG